MKRLLSGEGRLDRLGYLTLLLIIAVLFVAPLASLLATPKAARLPDPETFRQMASAAGVACWLLALWLYCAATARRLHDIDRSGWLTLLALLPVIGLGGMTVMLLLARGSPAVNRYGERWL